ncbi:MAG: helix-turn-helix transcriptional regulator [Aerococcus sp.]|nr:helix-turn-helix transcriptional regulator [Aerococcus sp.]
MDVAIKIVAKKWNGQIIERLNTCPMRFCQLRDSIPGVSDRILTERLRMLIADGIVQQSAVTTAHSDYKVYCLTEKGKAFTPVLDSLHAWAEDWVVLESEEELAGQRA